MTTVTITVNGRDYDVAGDAMLLRVLRDDIGALSVKEGCDDSTCGTCMVIANGRLVRTCHRPASSVVGQQIITTEGLSEREKEVYVHAFGETGAVQCGFCIPGMVMASKALLGKNPEPTRADVVRAIRTDICRCGGYRQIIDGTMLAGRMFRDGATVEHSSERLRVSDRAHRPDVEEKVLGTGTFADDVRLPGMVFAKALRSPTPRGLFKSIDLSKALAHPNCLAVLTADDVPENKLGHITPDWDVMIPVGDYTRYTGDALALVASDEEDKLDEIIALIDIDYEEAEPVTSPQQALSPLAPLVHERGNVYDIQHLKRGDPAKAFRESAHVVTHKFSTPWQEHAFMEPECAVAEPVGVDKLRMYTSSQSVYDEQREISRMLKVAPEQIRSTATLVGGGFGGKEDMSVQHHAALMAWKLKKPVKVKFSRTESLHYHTKRHPMDLEFTVGCDERGKLTGVKVVVLADTGAYASIGSPVLQRACTHAGGPYVVPNFEVLGLSLYTNNVPSGAFRGFGVPQSQFGMETCLNELADRAGLNDWEIRYLNAVRPGDPLPNGQLADESTGIADILEDIKGDYHANPGAGLALAYKNTGIGMGLADVGRCILSVDYGKVHIRTSASCMGQGVAQMVMHVLSEAVDLRPDQIVYELPDTERAPNSGTSTASRQTLFTGEATRLAAVQLREALDAVEGDLSKLEGQEWHGEFSPQTDPLDSPKPHPVSHVGYGFGAQLITLDENGIVEKVLAVYDVGTIINEQSAVGQIEGGVMMGLGYALTEEFVVENGVPQTQYGKLGLIRADKMPQVEVRFVTGPGRLPYAYGAKGMGEISLIPTAPAVARAYFKRDGKRRYSLPLRGTAYKPELAPVTTKGMARLGLERNVVDVQVLERTIARLGQEQVLLPTIRQLANPATIPDGVRARLADVDPDVAHPLNLFRVHWFNDAARRGLVDVPDHVELPSELTGVEARIVLALGNRFPMIRAHKVLAAYGCLVPRLVTGQFDPGRHKAIWPSTGNYCRGGVAISRILGCRGVAVLPENMSRERFDWLDKWVSDPADIIRTPGSESNVKEIYDACAALDRDADNIIFNQFCEFGNYLVHRVCTGAALEKLFDMLAQGRPGSRLAAFVSASGSSGTLAAGDHLKAGRGAKIVVVEAAECPTLLENGFGEHNIQGIGDKHVPYIHNVMNTDLVAGTSDADTDRLVVLFNTEVGRNYLIERRGIDPKLVAQLANLGLSSLCNMLAAIKTAKYYDLGPDDVIVTVATDGADMYGSELDKARGRGFGNRFDMVAAGETWGRSLAATSTDHLLEMTQVDRRRVFNLGYFTWVEQQGVSREEFSARAKQSFWDGLLDLVPAWDDMIAAVNAKSGANKRLGL